MVKELKGGVILFMESGGPLWKPNHEQIWGKKKEFSSSNPGSIKEQISSFWRLPFFFFSFSLARLALAGPRSGGKYIFL